jgi:glycosyltransferase involved in cell wall biosynthesis
MSRDSTPVISVVMPVFNRARFLPDAFASIASQRIDGIELIVVDDGSTDDTRTVVETLAGQSPYEIRYIHQENRGAYGARNTGLDRASGAFVAFFDSDDLWLPHHLERCLQGLQRQPDVDWVFGACTRVELGSGRVLQQNTFYVDDRPRPFLRLRTVRDGDLHIIDDKRAVRCQILYGFFCGLQNSLIRRKVFDGQRLWDDYRIVEDELFLIRALGRGLRVGYFMEPHVTYRVHEGNSSAAAANRSREREMAVFDELTRGFTRVLQEWSGERKDRDALRQRLAREYFWHLGYNGHWQHGETAQALEAYRCGLRHWPWSWRCWKTYLLAETRHRWFPPEHTEAA